MLNNITSSEIFFFFFESLTVNFSYLNSTAWSHHFCRFKRIFITRYPEAVLQIHDIGVDPDPRILPLTNVYGPDPTIFVINLQDTNKKLN